MKGLIELRVPETNFMVVKVRVRGVCHVTSTGRRQRMMDNFVPRLTFFFLLHLWGSQHMECYLPHLGKIFLRH